MDLVDVQTYGFQIDLTGNSKYSDERTFYVNKPVAEALLRAKELLPDAYNFLIKDGFRTLEIQKKIVEKTERELQESHPDNWPELLNIYTGGYEDLEQTTISYMNHRSGNTVDITLIHDGEEVDMGGVVLNERDRLDFFKENEPENEVDIHIRDNRRIFKHSLESVGFKAYPLEWWHWGYSK